MLTMLSEMEPKDVSATLQVSGSVLSLVGKADQLTEKAQVIYAKIASIRIQNHRVLLLFLHLFHSSVLFNL